MDQLIHSFISLLIDIWLFPISCHYEPYHGNIRNMPVHSCRMVVFKLIWVYQLSVHGLGRTHGVLLSCPTWAFAFSSWPPWTLENHPGLGLWQGRRVKLLAARCRAPFPTFCPLGQMNFGILRISNFTREQILWKHLHNPKSEWVAKNNEFLKVSQNKRRDVIRKQLSLGSSAVPWCSQSLPSFLVS